MAHRPLWPLCVLLALAGCSTVPPQTAHTHRPVPAATAEATAAPEIAPSSSHVNPITRLPPQTRPVPSLDQMPAFGSDDFNRIKDAFPDNPPDVSQVPDAEPVAEPPSKYGNKSPYTVLGETYVLLPSAKGYRESGKASWYGKKFHGLRTSSGEHYDMFKMSAAHRTLPLPSYVRVTNLANNKSVIVKVNDRGPFHSERIMDLSYAAAVRLDMLKTGTAYVRLEAIDPDEYWTATGHSGKATASSPAKDDAPPAPAHFYVQVGAFREAANAAALQNRLMDLVYAPVGIANSGSPAVNRVQIGPFFTREDAEKVSQIIRENDLGHPIVVGR
ncbi:MAG TPA: septal ring lytic transglycosylase RlpA family protein [Moraxellaceae bacterium]|nr:septal ring lytic transglycosylase RlpA family protein [Moraxellaceae bacterium]